jgi:microcystin-dependent protein
VYDLTSKLFYVNTDNTPGNHWFAINPMLTQGNSSTPDILYTSPVVTKVGIGMQPPQLPQATLDVNGDVHSKSLAVDGFANNALMPTGGIIMWSGDPANLPAGWALCDGATVGTFVTPDLRGRFIVGYDKNSSNSPTVASPDGTTTNYGAVKNTGGETGHILSKLELPKHTHVIGNGTDGSSMSDPGDHIHGAQTRQVKGDNGSSTWALDINAGDQGLQYVSPAGKHIHTGATGDGTTDGLTGKVHENRPPYYVLAFIIKLP